MFTVSKAILKFKRLRKSRNQIVCDDTPKNINYGDHLNKYKIFSSRIMQKMLLDSW
jgi:hypothetical protein